MKSKDICNHDLAKFDALEDMKAQTKRMSSEIRNKRLERIIFFIIIWVMMSWNICMAIYSGGEILKLKKENTTLKIQNQTLEKVLENSCLVAPRTLQIAWASVTI